MTLRNEPIVSEFEATDDGFHLDVWDARHVAPHEYDGMQFAAFVLSEPLLLEGPWLISGSVSLARDDGAPFVGGLLRGRGDARMREDEAGEVVEIGPVHRELDRRAGGGGEVGRGHPFGQFRQLYE